MSWETVWSFETLNTRVALEVTPCSDDPADSFEFEEDIEAVRNGDVEWFDARVCVYAGETLLGCDYLSGCAYNSVREFYESHRDRDPMNRNCSIMRAKHGENTSICHYFPSMVTQAIACARSNASKMKRKLRAIKSA